MKSTIDRINFKLKQNKTQTQKAIYLNQKYSANLRQLYLLSNSFHQKLPKNKFINKVQEQLKKLKDNINEEMKIYENYKNQELERFLEKQNVPNSYSLISMTEEKQNQIQNLEKLIIQSTKIKQKQKKKNGRKQELEQLKRQLNQQKNKRIAVQNKVQKIKQQLQEETKTLISNKITNFDQEIEYRKLEQKNNLTL